MDKITSVLKILRIILISLVVLAIGAIILDYYWFIPIHEPDDSFEPIMHFSLEDGDNWNDTNGCFFLMRAGLGVRSIDPKNYTFLIAEKGDPLHELDFNVRTYDEKGTPLGGDRNSTFNYTLEKHDVGGVYSDEFWNYEEYIGFDMPKKEMGIEIKDQRIYEVQIIDPKGKLIFKDTFVYASRGDIPSNNGI